MIESTIKSIPETFSIEDIKSHQDLASTEECINTDLVRYLERADEGDNLFGNIKEISYLAKPNHLIQKPFYAVYCLLGNTLPSVTTSTNFTSTIEIDKIWSKFRKWLKKKDFIEDVKKLNVSEISNESLKMVHRIYKDDAYMTERWIARESSAALSFFKWTIKVWNALNII